jgi:hypothetical protein
VEEKTEKSGEIGVLVHLVLGFFLEMKQLAVLADKKAMGLLGGED